MWMISVNYHALTPAPLPHPLLPPTAICTESPPCSVSLVAESGSCRSALSGSATEALAAVPANEADAKKDDPDGKKAKAAAASVVKADPGDDVEVLLAADLPQAALGVIETAQVELAPTEVAT